MPEQTIPPIVEPNRYMLLVPVEEHPTEEAAVAFTRDYWPDMECYVVNGRQRWTVRPVNLDDEDEAELHDEYGGDSIADLSEDGSGREYWVVATRLDSAQGT